MLVPQSTFRKADGFFLVYDPTREESVECLAEYLYSVKQNAALGDDTPLVLLGVTAPDT